MSDEITHAIGCPAAAYGGRCSCTDLVKLLLVEDGYSSWTGRDGLFAISAEEITRLRARVAALEAALRMTDVALEDLIALIQGEAPSLADGNVEHAMEARSAARAAIAALNHENPPTKGTKP